jgi:hypothetical protein
MKKILLTALLSTTLLSFTQAEESIKISDLTFKAPAPWKAVESSSPMRVATLHYPIEGSDTPLEVVFFYFGSGQGGDTEANIQRWLGQFDGQPESTREELTAGDKTISMVTAHGTYLDGPPFGGTKTPRPDYTLLGAIVPAADAPIFIKVTGPKADIAKMTEAFKSLAKSPF